MQVLPCCAIAMAKFAATVVFPSPGNEETTSTTWGGLPPHDSIIDVCSDRSASDSGELGRSIKNLTSGANVLLDTRIESCFDWGNAAPWPLFENTGKTATFEYPIDRRKSSTVKIRVSTRPRRNATAMPPSRAATIPTSRFSTRLGRVGAVCARASSTTRRLEEREVAAMPASFTFAKSVLYRSELV